ncbi:MAG: hypothetical protein JNM74_10630 [Myxococcales bacterium]|nr:hypothetical protein [Myxococcales bacterium]
MGHHVGQLWDLAKHEHLYALHARQVVWGFYPGRERSEVTLQVLEDLIDFHGH